jgi:hypothetical protein
VPDDLMMTYRGLLMAIIGVLLAAAGYAIGLTLDSAAGAWVMIAGLVVVAAGFAMHLLAFIARASRRRRQ